MIILGELSLDKTEENRDYIQMKKRLTLILPDKEIDQIGKEMYQLMVKLFPLCRSITGVGTKQTLEIIKQLIPIKLTKVKTGTKVLDWIVPEEWNINDAWIKDPGGKKIIDIKNSNLHVLNYSIPIYGKISLEKLREHLYTYPKYPDWIPYTTSYYKKNWGFCMSENQNKKLKKGIYEVLIDSSLKKGSLVYGELLIKGKSKKEVLISSYVCHPSLCNDNLSGPVLATYLAKHLLGMKLKYSYRFIFVPETIGAITWLSRNKKTLSNIEHGLVVTCVGDPGNSTYKKTRCGNAVIDKVVEKALIDSGTPYKILDFFPQGSDERQYSSPGFNLPMGSLMRTPYADYPQYHTSADNLDFVKPQYLADTFSKYLRSVYILESNATYLNLSPYGEPQLGRRGLYRMIGNQRDDRLDETAIFWVLNMSDGYNSLLEIALKSGLDYGLIRWAADALLSKDLLKPK